MQSVPLSQAPAHGFRALRINQVLAKTGLSRTHTYRLIKKGDHPKPIQLSERVFIWNEAAIDAYLEAMFGGATHDYSVASKPGDYRADAQPAPGSNA